jgi:hypothetical protein
MPNNKQVASLNSAVVTYLQSLGTIPGPVEIGQTGLSGTIYAGDTVSCGDDFSSLDIVGPSTPYSSYFTTRGYGGADPGPRGGQSTAGTFFDTDPLFTGYNDSNRGVAIGYNNMSVSNGILSLTARAATASEQAGFYPTASGINGGVRDEVGAMISTAGDCQFYPASGVNDIVEARIKFSPQATNPAGWHPTFWAVTANPISTLSATGSDEWDMAECNSQFCEVNRNQWTNGAAAGTGGTTIPNLMDGNWHVVSLIATNGTSTVIDVDGQPAATFASTNTNTKNEPLYLLFSSHVYNATYAGETYSQSAWDSSSVGATMYVDWWKMWSPSAAEHYTPLVSVPDLDVAFAGTGTIVLPSAATLWGDSSVTETVQTFPDEVDEPGMGSITSNYSGFPSGVSYNATTRTISVNFSSGTGPAGRMYLGVCATKPNGSTCTPLRVSINRGPHLSTASTLTATHGSPYSHDFYPECDVGILTPKTMTVAGLPAGLTFNGVSAISGTPTSAGTSTLTVSCTNNVGQQAQETVQLVVN